MIQKDLLGNRVGSSLLRSLHTLPDLLPSPPYNTFLGDSFCFTRQQCCCKVFGNFPRERYLNKIRLMKNWSKQGCLPRIIVAFSSTHTHHPDRGGHIHLRSLGRFPGNGAVLGEGGSLCPGAVLAGAVIMGPEEGTCATSANDQLQAGTPCQAPRLVPNCRSVFNFPQEIRLD